MAHEIKFRIVTSIVCTVLPLTCLSQSRWTLEDCISTGIGNNLEIRKQELAVQQGRIESFRTLMESAPSIAATASRNSTFRKDEQAVSIINLGLDASMSINLGMSPYFRSKSAKAAYNATKYEMLSLEKNVRIQVTEAFLNALIAFENLNFAVKNLEAVKVQMDNVSMLVTAGRRSAGSMAEMEAEVAGAQAVISDAEGEVASRLLHLSDIMNIPFNADMTLEPPEFDFASLSEQVQANQAIIDRLTAVHPSMMAMANKEKAAGFALKASIGNLFPTLSVGAGYSSALFESSQEKWRQQIGQNNLYNFNLTLSIPIISSFQAHSTVKKQKIAVESSSVAADIVRKELSTQLQALLIEAESCRKKLASAQKSCEAYEYLAAENEKKFAAGSLTTAEYTLILSKYSRAHSDFIQKKWQYYLILKTLDIYANE